MHSFSSPIRHKDGGTGRRPQREPVIPGRAVGYDRPMFTRCMFCHVQLPANELVEHFPHGDRIAFDPGRGRLWTVCPSCRRWNLAPIEDRWEALDELEKVVRDRGKLLSQTDNIALIRSGQVDIVRVGRDTRLVEEAWWRYGRELKERKARSTRHQYIEVGAMVALSLATGGGFWMFAGDSINQFVRWRQFGAVAWRGSVGCQECGTLLTQLKFKETKRLYVAGDGESVAIDIVCPNCSKSDGGRARLDGLRAQHVLRRVLAWQNFSGASEKRVRDATRAIEDAGSAERLTLNVAQRSLRIDHLAKKANRTDAIALEIALNDDTERRMLELELEALEERWREEEELASIVDGELTPMPSLEKLRRLINPDARIVTPDRAGDDVA
jgi:hypothetical protein